MTQAPPEIASPPPVGPVVPTEAADSVAAIQKRRSASQRVRSWVPIASHTGVDFFSFVPVALLPLLAVKLGFGPDRKSLLLGLGAVASGSIQPVVAWLGDKLDSRVFGPLGVVLAAVCVSSIGRVDTFGMLLLVYLFGLAGVGAFHPPAAAAVGQLAGPRRSAMISIFFLAGMIGGISGNVFSPMIVQGLAGASGLEGAAATNAGLRNLVILMPFGLVMAGVLWWAIRKTPHRSADAHDLHRSLPRSEQRARWAAFWLLYAGNTIRFCSNLALVYLFVEWTERLVLTQAGAASMTDALGVRASAINGPLQACMQVGMGGGGILLGFILSAKWEKRAFVAIPILGAIPIALFPYADRLAGESVLPAAFAAGALAIVAGVGFGSLIPVALALGQRLLPHRTAFASGMLLGGAWVFAFFGANAARVLHVGAEAGSVAGVLAAPFGLVGEGLGLEPAFAIVAGFIALAGVLCAALPGDLVKRCAPH